MPSTSTASRATGRAASRRASSCSCSTGASCASFGGSSASTCPGARWLRPGGVLVVTTPNRKRITNRVNRADTPMGPDHVSELTYDEALALFSGTGLQILETCGVYLELDLEWRSKAAKVDLAPLR